MSQAKITLIGIENYLNPQKSVFDEMELPDNIDKEVLIGAIMMRCQEFELLYSDPDFLMAAVRLWSLKHKRTFEKWIEALMIKYDPLYNYDRTEEYTDTHSGDFNRTGTSSDVGSSHNSRTDNSTMTNNLTDTNDVTTTHSEKAYNDTNYVGTTQDVVDQDETHTGTVSNTGSITDNGSYSNSGNTGENGKDNYTNIHKARLFGNIGVTTSQAMLLAEVNEAAVWNLYEHIADLFCEEFCIMVY